ncbi:MAG: hypothetical protein LIP08_10905 [Bacteroides sp.]|nr:hypothetical protein [Bacteroides sp.]
MGVKEVLNKQETTGHLFLVRQGLFLRGYNSGALMLEKLLGYKAQRVFLKVCAAEVCIAGFPSQNLSRVLATVEKAGGKIVMQNEQTVEIEGLDYPCTPEIIRQYPEKEPLSPVATTLPGTSSVPRKQEVTTVEKIITRRVLDYNLSASTPMEAMLFLSALQKEFGGQMNK